MAVDPHLQAQLEQAERENRLLDERLAAKSKAEAEAKPRTPAQRFVDNVSQAFNTNFATEMYRDVLANGDHGPGIPDPIFMAVDAIGGLMEKAKPGSRARIITNEQARRADYAATSKADPFTNAPGGLQAKAVAGAATLLGNLVGSAGDPTNLVGGPAKSVAGRMATAGAVNAVADVGAQGAGLSSGTRTEYDPWETIGSAAVGVGLTGTIEGGKSLAKTLVDRFHADGGKPPLHEAEVPVEANLPRKVEDAPESPAHVPPEKPQEAPKDSPATIAPATREKPAGDSPGGSQPGAEQGDPWASVDWGKMRSKERAKAATEHLDFLKTYIKPEHVRAFVNALDRPEVSGQVGGGERVSFINPKYVDWEALDSRPEDILQWANIRAAMFKDTFDAAGDAPTTWANIDRTSKLLGKDLSTLIKTHADITGEGGIAARVGALQQVTLEAADAFHAQLKGTRAAIEAGDMSGVANFAAATQRLVLLEAMAEGSSSEVARALNYMKRLKTPKAAVNDLQSTLDEFADAMNGGKPVDPESLKKAMDNLDGAFKKRGAAGVREEVAKMRELGFGDYVGYSIVGGMLSAPKTWIRNLVGTPVMAVFQTAERYLGAGVGAARAAAGFGSKERMTFAEANAYVASSVDALHDAFGNGWKAFKSGTPVTGGGSWAGEALIRPAPFQLTRERMAGWVKDGFSLHTAGDILGTIYFETVRTFGFRASVAADEFYKAITRRQQLGGLAYREAHFRATQADPKDYAKVFSSTLDGIKQDPTAQAFKEARQWFVDKDLDPEAVYPQGSEAEELALLLRAVDIEKMAADHATLMAFQDSGPLVSQIDRTLRMMPLVKWFYVPFFKTPMALLRAGIIDRNPATLGLLGENRTAFARLIETAKSDEAALTRGGAEADLAVARLMIGGAFMSFAFMLWTNGHLVGRRGEVGDPTKQDGVLEYSLKLPDDTWVQYTALDPILGSQLGLVADLAQTLRDRPLDDGQAEALVGGVFAAVRNNILNKAALSGLKDFFETFYGTYSSADRAGGKAAGQGLAASAVNLVPLVSLLRSTAQDIDPVRREARTFLEQVQSVVPTWTDELAARRDAFGRLLVRRPGERGVAQAWNTSQLSDDPLDLEQSRLAKTLLDFTLRPAQRRFNGQPVNGEEYSRILEVQGQLYRDKRTGLNLEDAALDLIISDDYALWSDEMRAFELKDLVSKYREEANASIKDPNSEFHMPEMVRRTATAQLTAEAPSKGLEGGRLRRRAKALGLSGEDLEAMETIFQP